MKMVHLIRHGQTPWNVDGKFQGKTDTPLSETGIEQGNLLAKRLDFIEIDEIISSPLIRAAETANICAKRKGLDVRLSKELTEVDFDHWEGLTLKEIQSTYPDEYTICRQDPVANGFRYGLTFQEVEDTAIKFIKENIEGNPNDNIAIFSHNVILKMLLIVLMDLPRQMIHSFFLNNCSISTIVIKDDKKILLKLNDSSHIDLGIDYNR